MLLNTVPVIEGLLLHGDDDPEILNGLAGNDTISSRAGDHIITGSNGRDREFLGNGNDVCVDSTKTGAFGRETITFGSGVDRFEFRQ